MTFRSVYRLASLFSFSFGFFAYLTIETVYKTHFSTSKTHFSMGLIAGVAFFVLYFLDDKRLSFFFTMVVGATLITLLELLSGLYLNLYLKLDIWDYRSMPFDLWGQICPTFSLIWLALSALIILFNRFLKREIRFLCLCN